VNSQKRADMFYAAGDAFHEVGDKVLDAAGDFGDFEYFDTLEYVECTYDRNGSAFYDAAHRAAWEN
jgi:hypothetical protein